MDSLLLSKGIFPTQFFGETANFILSVQQPDGSIPWFDKGKLDPWDHIEAAMGLSITGHHKAAENAYTWLQQQQLADGSWHANYIDGKSVANLKRETNFIAYIATGIWHHYLITQDRDFLQRSWPMVERAIEFVLQYQTAEGQIYWAVYADNKAYEDALITGCSSVLKSLECAYLISQELDNDKPSWLSSYQRLANALRNRPELFDQTWESKERFSMDWFYPILAGVYDRPNAKLRVKERWDTFVKKDLGCLCVSDEPWVTVAESCELTMALLAAGEHAKAVMVYGWLHQWRDQDGGYWTGYQYADNAIGPE